MDLGVKDRALRVAVSGNVVTIVDVVTNVTVVTRGGARAAAAPSPGGRTGAGVTVGVGGSWVTTSNPASFLGAVAIVVVVRRRA
ncbi:unnamed protein product [Closterium sp. NIES-53]